MLFGAGKHWFWIRRVWSLRFGDLWMCICGLRGIYEGDGWMYCMQYTGRTNEKMLTARPGDSVGFVISSGQDCFRSKRRQERNRKTSRCGLPVRLEAVYSPRLQSTQRVQLSWITCPGSCPPERWPQRSSTKSGLGLGGCRGNPSLCSASQRSPHVWCSSASSRNIRRRRTSISRRRVVSGVICR